MTVTPIPIREQPEKILFTGLLAMVLAPIVAQGLDRPLVHILGGAPSGGRTTVGALVVGSSAWLLAALRKFPKPYVAVLVPCLVAVGFSAIFSTGLSGAGALLVTGCFCALLVRWFPEKLPDSLNTLMSRNRGLTVVYVVAALLSIVQVARVSVFMGDPTRTDMQVVPGIKFIETHSCLTAYIRAVDFAHEHVDNLYLVDRWPWTVDVPNPPKTPYSPFDIDEFFYPPTFLLFTEILTPLRGDFLAQRSAWFGINGLLYAAAFLACARQLGGRKWHRPLLLAPLFLASLPSMLLLQIGNAQGVVVIGSVLAMLWFEVERPVRGGVALAFATVAKLTPGILGLILLVQMRWRSIAWTAAFGGAMVLLTALVYGANPIQTWVTYELPRLSSGEAFSPMLHHTESAVLNLAPAGIPFKLRLLGIELSEPLTWARRINWAYTLILVGFVISLARRHVSSDAQSRPTRALAWMALLYLSALRSPFAPGYVNFAFLWLITLLSVEVETWRGGIGLIFLFLISTIVPPLPTVPLAAYSLVLLPIGLVVSTWLILRPCPVTSTESVPSNEL